MQAVTTIGLDIARSVIQVHGVDAQGRRQSGRSVLAELLCVGLGHQFAN
jgi:hypothetical protein